MRVEPKRLDAVLKGIEKALTEKAAYMMRDQHGAAMVMLRGDQIIAWEVQEENSGLVTTDRLAR